MCFTICFRFIVPAVSDVDEPYMTRYDISAFVKYLYLLICNISILFRSLNQLFPNEIAN